MLTLAVIAGIIIGGIAVYVYWVEKFRGGIGRM